MDIDHPVNRSQRQTADSERLAHWLREHGRAVRGYVRSMIPRDDVVDDLVQDVFRRALEAGQRYQEVGRARAYLLRIADRLAIDFVRRAAREVNWDHTQWSQLETSKAENNPSSEASRRELREQLVAALAVLTEEQRRVLLLRYYGDMQFSEIAEVVGCPLNTALSHCRRGLQALREILGNKTT